MGHGVTVGTRGFTLLEVVLTLFILGLVAAVSLPTIGRATDLLRTRAEVATFSAILRHARERAITTQRPHAVQVDPAERRVTVVADDDDVRTSRLLPPRLSVHAISSPTPTVRFEPHGLSTGGDFRLVSGTISYRVTVDSLTGRVRVERE